MEPELLAGYAEAILFVSGEALDVAALAAGLGATVPQTEAVLDFLIAEYQKAGRGLTLKRFGGFVQLATKPEFADVIGRALQPPRKQSLSQSALETLAVVAWKQPVTRQDVEAVRGVKCDWSLQALSKKASSARRGARKRWDARYYMRRPRSSSRTSALQACRICRHCRTCRGKQVQMSDAALSAAVNRALGGPATVMQAQVKSLRGGTLGDVRLVWGDACMDGGKEKTFRLVWKRQKKWERPGDPGSWRREYDLYQTALGSAFTPDLRRPECYHSAINDDEAELWLEYVSGTSGAELSAGMLEDAARALGRFQGRIAAAPGIYKDIRSLSDEGFPGQEFAQWHRQSYTLAQMVSIHSPLPDSVKEMLRSGDIALIPGKSLEYACIRSDACGMPAHLRRMMEGMDESADIVFASLQSLPVVLCHRDFWTENLFWENGRIRLIDWDTTGWGRAGEDVASLVFDDTDPATVAEYLPRLLSAYNDGLSAFDISPLPGIRQVLSMAMLKFGYRNAQRFFFAEDAADRNSALAWLEAVHSLWMNPEFNGKQ